MPVQAFVDDSGGPGHSKHFVLAGLLSDSDEWLAFSTEWQACLTQAPAVGVFKMKEAAGLSGAFNRWTVEARDAKLRALAQVINRHVGVAMWMVIDLDAHAKYRLKFGKPHSEFYFFPFQTMILGVCFDLWDRGCRERFEIIFDEQVIFGLRAKKWYPVLLELMKKKHPEEFAIMPAEPVFKTDDAFLPLQACDLFAWCIRHNTDKPSADAFTWLLQEMPNVRQSDYSSYYDEDRFRSVDDLTDAALSKGDVWPELLDTAAAIRGSRSRGRSE